MAVDLAPTGLPVEDVVDDVRAALADRGAAVLQAEPGAGKTTVVPLRLLDEAWLDGGRIVVLEPRRLATRAAARRMADLLGEDVGATVGYRTRDERRVGRDSRIEVVTEGILTRRLQSDPSLPGTGLVVFDEVHERHLQTDLALALALDARAGLRPDLRLLAMSATPDAGRLAAVLGDDGTPAPVISSPGRTFPVEVHWRPGGPRDRPDDAVVAAVHEAVRHATGDLLVFLPGAAAIRRLGGRLALPDGVDIRPLHGSLPTAEQDLALAPSPPGRRRVVLATDIAESSLTVDGVEVVVDAGEVRRPRHDARSGLSRLQTTKASRASAEQRTGRAGRLGPGAAYRTWSAAEHAGRRAFAEPEIRSADLAGLALELAVWGAGEDDLAFLDPPPATAMADARALLADLGALDDDGRPTPTGRAMVDLPLHPRLARMVVTDRTATACALAALLEERDPLRARPEAHEADVTERLRLVADPDRHHPTADGRLVATIRRRAVELARRAGIDGGRIRTTDLGPVLALAYPDRIAQSRGGGRFRLRSGRGVVVADRDPLAGVPFLVVADLGPPRRDEADDQVLLAAALDEADVERLAGDRTVEATELGWNDRGDLEARTERRLDALVLRSSTARPAPGPATVDALVTRVADGGLGLLGWTPKARTLQARAGFARRFLGDPWPDLGDEALAASVDEWLVPLLGRATGRGDLARVDVLAVLRGRLGHLLHELDRVVPARVAVASGREVPVDYDTDPPAISVRAQELYGTEVHPSVASGRVPLTVEVLSPAGRPIQVTGDLPGFWTGSWAAVRKDMISAYPKHDWPADPVAAQPTTRARRGR